MGFSAKARQEAPPRDYGGVLQDGVSGFLLGRLVVFGLALARCVPPRVFYRFTSVVARLLLPLAPEIKRQVQENLRALLGPDISPQELNRIVRENLENTFSRKWSDVFLLPVFNQSYFNDHVEIIGLEHYRRAVAKGHGVLLITHHTGSYGLLAGLVLPLLGNPISGGVRRIFDNSAEAALFSTYQYHGAEAVNPGKALKTYLRRLKSGGTVLLAGDHLTSPKGIRMEYLGRETLIPGGPATLACRYQPTTLPCYCVRTAPDQFLVEFGAPFEVPTGDDDKDVDPSIHAFARQYLKYFENVVRRYPEQWECFFEVWPKTFEKSDLEVFYKGYGINIGSR